MERNFPNCNRQIVRGCVYLPTNGMYTHLMEGLQRSIMVRAVDWNGGGQGCICEVQYYLAGRYGGPPERFTQWRRSIDVYLIKLPHNLTPQSVVYEGREWGNESGWIIREWDVTRGGHNQPKLFTVSIKVTEFPLEFWHPFFVHMVMAEFGYTSHINNDNMPGDDRSELNITVRTIDPRRIPYSTVLPFGSLWKECYFEITGWEYIGNQPEEARYEQRGDEDARAALVAAYDKLLLFQAARSPPPSSSSSTSGSQVGGHGGPVDQEGISRGVQTLSPCPESYILLENLTAESLENRGMPKTLHQSGKRKSENAEWEALSKPDRNVAVRIGEIPVVCQDLHVSTLFVGSHPVSRHIRSDLYERSKPEIEQGEVHKGTWESKIEQKDKNHTTQETGKARVI